MKIAAQLSFALLAIALSASDLLAQDKVAEGEYQLTQANAPYPQKHWVLTSRASGGYSLRAEAQTRANGIRVLQLEELDDQLVPTRFGHELYLNDSTEPNVVVSCTFAKNSITCDGKSEKGTAQRSKPYPYKGPILLSVRDLSYFDFGWLMAGAINMARLAAGTVPIRTIHLTGGAALELTDDISVATLLAITTPKQKFLAIRPQTYTPWEFISDDEDVETLAFLGMEEVKLNETKVPVRHYSLQSSGETLHFWIAAPGILLKMTAGDEAEYVLANYHQYKKLIPELKVDEAATKENTR